MYYYNTITYITVYVVAYPKRRTEEVKLYIYMHTSYAQVISFHKRGLLAPWQRITRVWGNFSFFLLCFYTLMLFREVSLVETHDKKNDSV